MLTNKIFLRKKKREQLASCFRERDLTKLYLKIIAKRDWNASQESVNSPGAMMMMTSRLQQPISGKPHGASLVCGFKSNFLPE